eukprot:GHVR01163856.1.p1 GENE.GHVR01163856.1~~GHVR01163856.1.p1  ORF type:complete len:323 (-),score=21.05 GHVR01163856.1:68-1036(-)
MTYNKFTPHTPAPDPIAGVRNVMETLLAKLQATMSSEDKVQKVVEWMQQQNYPPEAIQDVIDEPNLLNAIIRARDESYRNDIKDIYDKVQRLDHNDPEGNVPGLTPREQRIWNKVRVWFTAEMKGPNADGARQVNNYLPNDNAVNYVFLVFELLLMINMQGPYPEEILFEFFYRFCRDTNKHYRNKSQRQAWNTLGSITTCVIASRDGNHHCNITTVASAYVNDIMRTAVPVNVSGNLKLTAAHQRTIRRLARMGQTFGGQPGIYQCLFLEGERFAETITRLSILETKIKTYLESQDKMQKGIPGLSDAEGMLYQRIQVVII